MQLKNLRTRLIKVAIAVSSFGALIAFQNCANNNFGADAVPTTNAQGNPGGGGGPTDGNGVIPLAPTVPPYNCSTVLQNSTFPAKLIFIVDISGSNASNPGTDPLKAYRGGSIQAFFNTYSTKTNFFWGFSTFAGTSAQSIIGNPMPILSNNASDMQGAINTFNGVKDDGNTPYQQAIAQAKLTIVNDSPNSAANATAKYMIVFMSDGRPNPTRTETQLAGYVQDALSAAPGRVSFNTIYYGALDNEAGNRMYKMSQVGGGQFLDVNLRPQNNTFPISNVVQVPGVSCPAQ